MSIINEAKYFSWGIFQNHLVIILAKKYIKHFTSINWVESWKPNGMSEEWIEIITKTDSSFAPTFVDHHLLPEKNYNGHCLMKNNIYIPKKALNLYISDTSGPQLRNLNTNFTLVNCLFGSVKPNKNVGPEKYRYTGYDVGLDSLS